MSRTHTVSAHSDKFLRRRTIAALAFTAGLYAANYAALEAAFILGWHAA
ncbi:hypothetical protein [Tsukamurella strandjordii]|uniref:Uncharacterized protein n=1 Tax=Tsukamurella strandjordii TaxID=147577 RepID=A0AA90SM17_9ACTN|nr:hypothetical protein [Tsukamurella strandjordii]MDP0398708.1 hypothetical protein [Tsukamurella strandjordii]